MRHTGHCRSGWTRCRARWPRPTRCRETSTLTWPSPAPGSPGCGRPTTWPARSPACGSRSARRTSPGSARPGATAAGAPRCSRRRWPSSPGWRAGTRPSPCTGRCSDRGRGGPGRRGRGHRLPLGQGRHRAPRPLRHPARARPGRDRRGAGVRVRRGGPAAADRRRGARARRGDRRARRDVHAALRGHPPRPAGAGPGRGGAAARGRGPRGHPGHRDRAGEPAHADGDRAGAVRDPGHRGLHAAAARPGACHRAGVLADDRDRAAAGGGVGADRPGRPADLRRPPAHDHLRPADGRRAAGVRRPRRAVSPGVGDQARLRPGPAGLRGAAAHPDRPVPGPRAARR